MRTEGNIREEGVLRLGIIGALEGCTGVGVALMMKPLSPQWHNARLCAKIWTKVSGRTQNKLVN
ncbi:hypothetical protein BDZ45DRAFT_210949 [Acephala macrosclerotiorum]|nr:hypothetical protein BDZ45DRAFT_210949 [Acephala macrosclerotiorum]